MTWVMHGNYQELVYHGRKYTSLPARYHWVQIPLLSLPIYAAITKMASFSQCSLYSRQFTKLFFLSPLVS